MTVPRPEDLREVLVSSALLCPLEWNQDRTAVLFARLDEEGYRAASFLDRRIVSQGVITGVVPWELIQLWSASLPRRCDFVFHVSHCGSTLLTRLLGRLPGMLAVREPGILRRLVPGDAIDRLAAVAGLLSRSFHRDQRPLVKATSIVNRIAPQLLGLVADARAVLMFVAPETFMAATLDGSPTDVTTHADERLARLGGLGVTLEDPPRRPGELAAAAWLCEFRSLEAAAAAAPGRTRWLDFDRLLPELPGRLASVARFLGHDTVVEALLEGGDLHRYAKKPDVAYDATLRATLLAAAHDRLADEIDVGLAWLSRAGWSGRLPADGP